jgi:hypothetical protein
MKAVIPPSLICVGILLGALSCFADTVTLKSGEILNGTILSDTEKEVVMDVTIAAGISDQKTLAKADVQTITKTTADQAAFEPIKDWTVGARSLPLANYDVILRALESFVSQYPQSAHAAEVKARIEAFKGDQAHVKAGDLKWDNHWYTREQADKNKAFLGSQMLLATMKEQAARNDFIGALNSFATFEKTYPGTLAFPDAVEIAQNQLRVAAAALERVRATAKIQEDEFNKGVQLAGEPQKSLMINTRNAQIAAADAKIAAAEHDQVKWKPLLPLSKKSFESLKTSLTSEAPRINKFAVADMRKSLATTDAAGVALQAKNADEADAKIKEAQTLWKENSQIAGLNAQLKTLKDELKHKGPKGSAASATSGTASDTASDASANTGAPSPSPSPTPKAKHWYDF